jgi:hypothetical protein
MLEMLNRPERMNSNSELYEFIKDLQNELHELREFSYGKRLSTALSISSVGAEVFMALRWELSELLKSEVSISRQSRDRIEEAISDIGYALR